ncbi:MAG: LysM peptidoglycan-binding domain-containing protein [bacterium]|nr:LysM peptidoglycan-binding domain-containing protein [bacterium]
MTISKLSFQSHILLIFLVAFLGFGCASTPTNPSFDESSSVSDAESEQTPETPDAIVGDETDPFELDAPPMLGESDEVPETELAPLVEEEVEYQPDPEALQQEALELCQSAGEFLDLGEMDDAIAALDRAYELMLTLPNNGNIEYLQAKEDIRRLVASLIDRTYGSQQTAAAPPRTSWDLEISITSNEHVQREIRSFTTVEREVFIQGYQRSGLYRPMILAKLEEAGLPSQLSWMPMVESWFKVRALSRASALGMWQFIHSTGLRYGLKRDSWIDERMDPEKSTGGAIDYLIDLHGLFGDWPKALAGYNCGEARVARLQKRNPGEYLDFWDLYALLPRETRRYVPRFYAALLILEDPEKYGMELPEPFAPLDNLATIPVNRPINLNSLDAKLGLDTGTLKGLNPELRHGATPKKPYDLKVPGEQQELIVAAIGEMPEYTPPTPQYSTHRVRRGETLSSIAARYRTSVRAIMRTNNLRSAHRIYPGQRLRIPGRGGGGSVAVSTGTYNAAEGTHTVNRGESLYSIARRNSTTVAGLKTANGLNSDVIYPGMKLKIQPGSRGDLRRYQVVSGDTLGAIADRHRVSLSALLRANGMSSRSTIYPGQMLVIP